MRILTALLLLVPLAAQADPAIDRVLGQVVTPGLSRFVAATDALDQAAQADCRAESADLRTAWNGAMDAWFAIADLRFGPLEDGARRQVIAYWPDKSGHRPKALSRILSSQDPALTTPERYGEQPVSVRGLYAIEAMLYDPRFNTYGATDPGCALVRAATADLARTARDVATDWNTGFAETLRTAGEAGNPRFLDEIEARQVIFTALLTSLQFDITERLGLPLGTPDTPRPTRAEGRLSQRSQHNLELALAAHQALALALVPEGATMTEEDFERVRWMASKLDDPDFSAVEDPMGRFRLEAVQTALTLLRAEANEELSAALGVTMGLNALDGD
ncbi:imelysin family protein [Defluviimonas sp. WL0002]|uniref:Imelysin family protein n=1 Tax=Albidovulum marisflavi TaxID=2984159 RepID=A0ABT2ZD34_9RHOB|nr:imelysin family protein [Defluviimonas sp. WL0002]MCV2868927.1 imelysin family protein [Defluviimonas sp. WL0002]